MADPAVRVSVPAEWGEVCGALLLDLLGPYQEIDGDGRTHMVFYPFRHGPGFVEDEVIRAALPDGEGLREAVEIERILVPGGWEEGWKEHFHPISIGRLYIRPPWEEAPDQGGLGDGTSSDDELDIVLNPGLAFGTGLHATTRGVLDLLQRESCEGPILDAGTGSGILSIAAAKLGYEPVRAFDNDPIAVEAARVNAQENGVVIEVVATDTEGFPPEWADGATVLANMTLEPVLALTARLTALWIPFRALLVSGILVGDQERAIETAAAAEGLVIAERIHESEWVSMTIRRAGDR